MKRRSPARDGRRVTDAPLELADESFGLGDATALGRVAEEQLAVADEDHARGAVRVPAEREGGRHDELVGTEPGDRGGRPARADIDCQEQRRGSSVS